MEVDITLDADFVAVAGAVEAVLSGCGLTPAGGATLTDDTDALRLALTEALNNVIEHGGTADRRPRIRVVGKRAGDRVALHVEDDGPPLPDRLLRDACDDPVERDAALPDFDDLPEGGWGLVLIRASVDRLSARRRGRINRLTLERRLRARV